jgi:ankyrin repeat protein
LRCSETSARVPRGDYTKAAGGARPSLSTPQKTTPTNSDRDETAFDPEATGKKLFDAAVNGRGKVVREILAAAGRGPYIDYKNSFGQTPLYMASYGGKHECVKMLLEHGAGVDLQTASGRTALIAAALDEKPECVKLLLEYGASVSAVDAKGKSALDHARAKGFTAIVSMLELSVQRSPKNSVPRGNRCD